MKLTLERINETNIIEASLIEYKIFNYERECCSFLDYVSSYLGFNNDVQYIAKNELGDIVGVTGYYFLDIDKTSAWLSWFGVLPEYQRMGVAKNMLELTINKVKLDEHGFDFFRVYYVNVEQAEPLYRKIFDVKEDYLNDEMYYNNTPHYIYSKSLKNKQVELWNSKLMGCHENETLCAKASIILDKINKV